MITTAITHKQIATTRICRERYKHVSEHKKENDEFCLGDSGMAL